MTVCYSVPKQYYYLLTYYGVGKWVVIHVITWTTEVETIKRQAWDCMCLTHVCRLSLQPIGCTVCPSLWRTALRKRQLPLVAIYKCYAFTFYLLLTYYDTVHTVTVNQTSQLHPLCPFPKPRPTARLRRHCVASTGPRYTAQRVRTDTWTCRLRVQHSKRHASKSQGKAEKQNLGHNLHIILGATWDKWNLGRTYDRFRIN